MGLKVLKIMAEGKELITFSWRSRQLYGGCFALGLDVCDSRRKGDSSCSGESQEHVAGSRG